MANTNCFRNAGQTTALSVIATSHVAVTVPSTTNDQTNFASFLNTGATTVAINVAATGAAAAVLPVDGTPQTCIILPPNMQMPVVYVVPANSFSCTAIGSGAGPSLVYITPVSSQ